MASMVEQTTLDFIERWEGHGDEKQETQRFWIDLLENVLHRPNPTAEVSFEERTAGNGYIDALFPDARFLVEQKSASVDLDKPEMRQGTPVTPAQQAVRYVSGLLFSKKPSVICTCNFKHFRFYDLETDPQAQGTPVDEFDLTELPEHLDTFRQIFSPNHSRIVIQQQLSEKAGLLVANLHNALAKQYVDPDNEASHHALAVLTVRFVFCLYAEDANLFTPDAFTNYVKATDAEHLRRAIVELFEVLDTKESERDPYLEKDLRDFPYVNGGLFRGKIEIPQFSEEIRDALINAGENFTWKDISPVIFGSLMEETLSHDQRRQGGMHYTTVKNIHRVIDPLFLDGLKEELASIENDPHLTEIKRKNRLVAYQDKLASLQFLDKVVAAIENGLDYPKVSIYGNADYNETLHFLEALYDAFDWKTYEPRTLGATKNGEPSNLKFYTILLRQWLKGKGIKYMIEQAISYKRGKAIYVNKQHVPFDGSPEHINKVIEDTLNTVNMILSFQLSNYFIRFSNELKKYRKSEYLPNDWYEYVEYGTTNKVSIVLQKDGFTAEAANYINEKQYFYRTDKGIKLSMKVLDCGRKSVQEEARAVYRNMPELFEE